MEQPTVREINRHLFAGTRYCHVETPEGVRFRISRARTRKGITEGRVINANVHWLGDWVPIPADARVELS